MYTSLPYPISHADLFNIDLFHELLSVVNSNGNLNMKLVWDRIKDLVKEILDLHDCGEALQSFAVEEPLLQDLKLTQFIDHQIAIMYKYRDLYLGLNGLVMRDIAADILGNIDQSVWVRGIYPVINILQRRNAGVRILKDFLLEVQRVLHSPSSLVTDISEHLKLCSQMAGSNSSSHWRQEELYRFFESPLQDFKVSPSYSRF